MRKSLETEEESDDETCDLGTIKVSYQHGDKGSL